MAISLPQAGMDICLFLILTCFFPSLANKVIYMSDASRNCAGGDVDASSSSDEGGLIYSQLNLLYSNGVDCSLTITVAEDRQVAVNLATLSLPSANSSSPPCGDHILIYNGDSSPNASLLSPVGGLCGTWTESSEAVVYSSSGNKMTIHFYSNLDNVVGEGFLLVYVAFALSRVTHTCERAGDFRCDNGMCIDSKFICDGYEHCDGSDESSDEDGANCHQASSDFLGQILELGNLPVACILGALFVFVVSTLAAISYCFMTDKCCQKTQTWYREKYVRYSEAVMGEVAGSGKYHKKTEPEARVKPSTNSRFVFRKQSASFSPNSGSRDGNTSGVGDEFKEYYRLTTTFAVNPESLKQLGTKLDSDGRPVTEV